MLNGTMLTNELLNKEEGSEILIEGNRLESSRETCVWTFLFNAFPHSLYLLFKNTSRKLS